MTLPDWFTRRLLFMLPLGFASGLPLALSTGTLQAWFALSDVDIKTIGLLSLVGLPYTIKFLWAPLLDRYVPPLLGRRRGWMLVTQLMLAALLFLMGLNDPDQDAALLGMLAFLVAFFSASQDIAFDAYRTDALHAKERGLGAAFSVYGYRIAMLVSGALALILGEHIGWSQTYMLMALIMGGTALFSFLAPEPDNPADAPPSLMAAAKEPLKEFFSRPYAVWLLATIILYKLGDAFAGTLTTTFLLRALEFTPTEVGAINKGFGLAATLFGALAGGLWLTRLGLWKSLLIYGVLQAITNLGFMVLALMGKSYPMMVAVVGLENLAGGMGTAAFVAFIMALCDHRYTATQFALLSALAALGRVFVGPPSGLMVDSLGWAPFFLSTFIVALPGLVLLWWMRPQLLPLDHPARDGNPEQSL